MHPVSLLALAGMLTAGNIHGSGVARTEARALPPFRAVQVAAAVTLTITAQDKRSVTVSGDDNIVAALETVVQEDVLTIRARDGLDPVKPLVVAVAVPGLDKVSVSGACDLSVTRLRERNFQLDVSGAGRAHLGGEVENLLLTSSGAAQVDATALRARAVKADLSGATAADVFAAEELDARISGIGRLRYAGNPKKVKKDVSGVGSISPK